MKKYLFFIALFIFYFNAKGATIQGSDLSINSLTNPIDPFQHFSTLSIKEVQKLVGRKLKLKEKIAVKIFQWKHKKDFKQKKGEAGSDKGKTAMILGIVGIGLLFIPFLIVAAIPCAILAIIFGNQARKIDRNDRKAKTAIILGWVTIGFIAIVTILIAAIVLSLGGWG
jgi:hypothetical protein